jgi:riboflavin synthase
VSNLFSGIITEIGVVESLASKGGTITFRVKAPKTAADLEVGESVAVNGACQTATAIDGDFFSFDSVAETLKVTNLSGLGRGSRVNLELALRLGDRISGHLVSGHVDSTGIVRARRSVGRGNLDFSIQIPGDLRPFIHKRGSICLDGVSLTVKAVSGPLVEVTLIPHTLENTIIGDWRVGTSVNVEADMIARYVALAASGKGGGPE